MPGLTELAYTTLGGLIGSGFTTLITQARDRRSTRAVCQRHLRQISKLGAATEILDDQRDRFHEALTEWEIAALTAGMPSSLVELHISLREEFYYVLSTHQKDWNSSLPGPLSWDELIRVLIDLLIEVEGMVKACIWHPWRNRVSFRRKLRKISAKFKRLHVSLDEVRERRREVTRREVIELNSRESSEG